MKIFSAKAFSSRSTYLPLLLVNCAHFVSGLSYLFLFPPSPFLSLSLERERTNGDGDSSSSSQ